MARFQNPRQERVYRLCVQTGHAAMMAQQDGFGSAYRRGFTSLGTILGNRLYERTSLAHAAYAAGRREARSQGRRA